MTKTVPLGFMNRSVPPGSHLCAFYTGPSGRDEVVLPFLAEGLRAGQRCICILESLRPDDVVLRLGRQVDLDQSVETGQLELATPAETYLRSGAFSASEMLDYWAKAEEDLADGRFSFARVAGEIPAALEHRDPRGEFFRYEARLTDFISDFRQVIVCLYDLSRFGARVLMDALRTHAMVIVDGVLHENPYFIEPDRFLRGADLADDGRPTWRR